MLLVVAAGVVFARARLLDRWRALALAASAAVYGVAYLKEGFIRNDAPHAVLFLQRTGDRLLAITWPHQTRWVAAAVVAATLGAAAVAVGSSSFVYHPFTRARIATNEARTLLFSSRRERALASARAATRTKLGLDSTTVAELRRHSVDIEPYETSAIWLTIWPGIRNASSSHTWRWITTLTCTTREV